MNTASARHSFEATDLEIAEIPIRVWSSEHDVEPINFFFGQYRKNHDDPAVEVRLDSDSGFFASLLAKDRTPKRAAFREKGAARWHELHFSGWSWAPAPLPPFQSAPFRSNFLVVPGAVLREPGRDGRTNLLVGPNYAGKTTLALHLLDRGWGILADHLALIRADGCCMPFLGPVGIRGSELRRRGDAIKSFDTREVYSYETGRVCLARIQELYPTQVISDPLHVDTIVALHRGSSYRLAATTRVALDCYPIERGTEMSTLLGNASAYALEVPASADWDLVATLLEEVKGTEA